MHIKHKKIKRRNTPKKITASIFVIYCDVIVVVFCIQKGAASQSGGRSEVTDREGQRSQAESSAQRKAVRRRRRRMVRNLCHPGAQSLFVVATPSDLVKSILA